MSELDRAQELFWRAITWPSGVADFLNQTGAKTRAELARTFGETSDFARVPRLDVYAQAYFYRVLSVLGELFPLTAWISGEIPFHNLVTDYLLAHPSRDPDLRRVGQHFPDFIAAHSIRETALHLHQVAAIELARCDLLDCTDNSVVSREVVARVPAEHWPDLRFRLQRGLRVIDCDWDVERLMALHAAAATPDAALARNPSRVLVFRRGHGVRQLGVSDTEAAALIAALRGESFAAICSEIEAFGASPEDAAQLLENWLNLQLIAELEPNPR